MSWRSGRSTGKTRVWPCPKTLPNDSPAYYLSTLLSVVLFLCHAVVKSSWLVLSSDTKYAMTQMVSNQHGGDCKGLLFQQLGRLLSSTYQRAESWSDRWCTGLGKQSLQGVVSPSVWLLWVCKTAQHSQTCNACLGTHSLLSTISPHL